MTTSLNLSHHKRKWNNRPAKQFPVEPLNPRESDTQITQTVMQKPVDPNEETHHANHQLLKQTTNTRGRFRQLGWRRDREYWGRKS